MKQAAIIFSVLVGTLLLACGENSPREQAQPEPTANSAWIAKGKQIADATMKALSAELIATIEQQGVEAAIDYCNQAAYPITDSLAQVHNATIRRTSLNYRNPANAPTRAEEAVLMAYAAEKGEGKKPGPRAIEGENGQVHFYAPILLKGVCMNCHGSPGGTITEPVLERIAAHYPDDKATGYNIDDLRGMWHITFDREQPK